MSAWNSDPVVLTVAVTGADVFRENNPNIPYTTEEIADSSIEAGAAGATVVHLHVREDDGTPSGRPELFKDVIERIRAGCDLLTMVSTGGANDMTIEERTTGLEAKPDISGVESGSMNFGDETFITPPPAGRGIIERATEAGIALEVEAFDVGHVVSAVRWLEEGILPPPAADQPRLRRARGHRRLPRGARRDACARCPSDAFWTVTCIGRHHPRMLALALLHGAPGIRTGLEDVAYLRRGVLAPSNAALVEMAVSLTGTLGREVATQDQTKELLAAWLSPARPSPRAPAGCSQDGRSSRRRGPETREAIHRAAIELFARLGYHATSMRAIASAAGVQPAAIYHWYPSKEAILVAAPGRLHGAADREGRRGDGAPRPPGPAAGRRGARARRLPRHPPARRVRDRQRDPGAHRGAARAR